MMWDNATIVLILKGLAETLYMTVGSTLIAYILGLPLGILLIITESDGLKPLRTLNKVLNVIVNLVRSVPFLILLMAVSPLTRLIVGTTIGPTATIVSLVIASTPFIARLVESSLKELDKGITEASQSMGCSIPQIILRVWLPEIKPSLILGAAIGSTTILSYSAMAGIVAGGGLGDIAIRYGYYRFQDDIMIVTVIILVIIVQIMQEIGMRTAKKLNKQR